MLLTLTRTEQTPDGTFGTLDLPGYTLCTMEDDWLNNQRGKSCIPAGEYVLRRTVYYKHGYETFEVTGVPDRSRILIHPANTEEDVEGCIGVGLRFGELYVHKDEDTGEAGFKKAVVSSKEAFRRFMRVLASVDKAELVVKWVSGLPR